MFKDCVSIKSSETVSAAVATTTTTTTTIPSNQFKTNDKHFHHSTNVHMDKLSVKNHRRKKSNIFFNEQQKLVKKSIINDEYDEQKNEQAKTSPNLLSSSSCVEINQNNKLLSATTSTSTSSSLSLIESQQKPSTILIANKISEELPIEYEQTSYGSSTNYSLSGNNNLSLTKSRFLLIKNLNNNNKKKLKKNNENKSSSSSSSLIHNGLRMVSYGRHRKNDHQSSSRCKRLTNNSSFYDSFRMKSFRFKSLRNQEQKQNGNNNDQIDSIETTCNENDDDDDDDDADQIFVNANNADDGLSTVVPVSDTGDHCKCKNKNNQKQRQRQRQRQQSSTITAAQKHRNELKREESSRLRQEKKAARQLGVILGAFILCWMPYIITYVVTAYCAYCISLTVHQVTIWLGYLNSFLNPFLYALCNENFKHAFKKMLGRQGFILMKIAKIADPTQETCMFTPCENR
ncbi:hypothetical protein HUG17_10449 [Dermatophagoides farinae]|uniref:G-protein coupled receptors family 1 profile domain-containing protein n=1 Tax=Dermatophagoides farinae TaxID=6954 RepID=A0A9D4NQ52_DERFA|nr:hypothetical protein HUG17_10449 [Dermatophagoides farinae]